MTLGRWQKRRVSDATTAMHRDWERFVRSLQSAGLLSELTLESIPERLGAHADEAPDAISTSLLFERYYRGDGDLEAGLRRIRADRYVAHRERDRATAREIVARLRLAIPEIGPLGLVEEDGVLKLRTFRAQAVLPDALVDEDHMTVMDTVYVRRTVTVRTLVAATNELLRQRNLIHRFVPLDGVDGEEAYVAVEPADALILDSVDALEAPLSALRPFAGWSKGPLVVFPPPTRSVA